MSWENLELETYEFDDHKHYKKFVNVTKSIIRKTVEYNTWVNYIKYSLGYNYCSFTREVSSEVTIDLHHHPISLENIVRMVIDKMLITEGKVTTLDVAKHVLKLHYDNNVGYILLARTIHEKFHNGFLKIPIEFVHGNWTYLLENYPVDEEIRETIDKYVSVKLEDVKEEYGERGYTWSRDNYVITEGID